ncbi:hypothetical protein SAMN05421678_11850 [Actinopolymorpha cephalotaxi]|uniref:Uncharacterized protein n=1 Tax=Actinopolymorpha cephalotaxi TaxID=504797 RepID=A0A1I3A7F0_9ACTN|nr:hypothetical protein [Actinopolymorpha cephalotaxi]SFH45231.1 hypothetical protein SAMN05421678_11850 [Actinopolymorpha cephalotaxi]
MYGAGASPGEADAGAAVAVVVDEDAATSAFDVEANLWPGGAESDTVAEDLDIGEAWFECVSA